MKSVSSLTAAVLVALIGIFFSVIAGQTAVAEGITDVAEATTANPPYVTATLPSEATTIYQTTTASPTYPPIPNPYMEIELDGEMHASYAIAMSCLNSYSKQFTDTLKSQLQRAKDAMLATPTFCPDTTSADLRIAYVNMAAVDTEVYLRFGVDIVSYGINTLDAMSSCAWQLGAYLSTFSNWRQPIWMDIYNCPRLTFAYDAFSQTDVAWVC